jgi:hypothetical protein
MPKYWIMFHATAPGAASPTVFQTSRFDNSETDARAWFEKTHPDGTILHVRKVKQFTQSEIRKERDKLKYKVNHA